MLNIKTEGKIGYREENGNFITLKKWLLIV